MFAESVSAIGRLLDLARSVLWLVLSSTGARSRPTLRRLRDADAVVAKGGYVYRERGGLGGLLAGWFTMWPLVYGSRCGTTCIVYGASVGPFHTRASRALSRFVLGRADWICPREADSERRLRTELRLLSGGVVPMPDCVFGLHGDPRLDATGPVDRGSRVVAVPRGVPAADWPDFRRVVAAAVDAAALESVEIVLQGGSDRAAAPRLIEELDLAPECLSSAASPSEAVEIYRRSRLVVTGRMHGAIMAALAETPMLMVEIPDEVGKAGPVLRDVGLPWAIVDASMSDRAVTEVVARLLEPQVVASLPDAVRALRDRVVDAEDSIVEALR